MKCRTRCSIAAISILVAVFMVLQAFFLIVPTSSEAEGQITLGQNGPTLQPGGQLIVGEDQLKDGPIPLFSGSAHEAGCTISPASSQLQGRPQSRAGDAFIFSDDFESGTSSWTIQDQNANNGLDYWDVTKDRARSENFSLYCAGVGGTTSNHVIVYDTAEYTTQYGEWVTYDTDDTNGRDYWGISANRSSSGSYSYSCIDGGVVVPEGDLEAVQNLTDVSIPDYDGSTGTWVASAINITTAPAGSIVTAVEIYCKVDHSYVSDIYIDLENQDLGDGIYERLWNRDGAATDNGEDDDAENDADVELYNYTTDATEIHTFDGMAVNQRWTLWAYDGASGDTGFIDQWWIKVHYTNDNTHYDDYMKSYLKRKVDLTGHTNCQLSFDYWLDVEDIYDIASVRMAATDSLDPEDTNWTELVSYSDGYDSQDVSDTLDSTWQSSGNIDISAFDNTTCYLMFYFTSDTSVCNREGWYVDNIKITGNGKSYDDYMDSYAEVTVNLQGYNNAHLEFLYWLDAEDYYDTFNVSVKNTTDTVWTKVFEVNDASDENQFDGADPDIYARQWWWSGQLSLDSFCGNDAVQIRFWFYSDSATVREGLYIDDVEVSSILFFDDMESGINGWTTTSPTEPNWHQVTDVYFSSTTSWWCGSDGTSMYGDSMDEYLTHTVDLSTAEKAALRFAFTGAALDEDYLYVAVSADEGQSWDYFYQIGGDWSDGWYSPPDLSLSSYIPNEIQITFDFYSNKTGTDIGFFIDDVLVYGTADLTPPEQVVNLTAEAGGSGTDAYLHWNSSMAPDLDGYKVYRGTGTGGPYTFIENSSTNSYHDTGLTTDYDYYYVVSAFDLAGNEGLQSLEAVVTMTDLMPPGPALNVSAHDLGIGDRVLVRWDPNPEKDLAGYKVYYETASFTDAGTAIYYPASPIGDPLAIECTVVGLETGTTYHFAVTAIDKSDNENTTISKTVVATPLDITDPTVDISYPSEGNTVKGRVRIELSIGDVNNISAASVSVDKSTVLPASYNSFLRKWVAYWDTMPETDGSHTLDAQAEDEHGNIGYSSTVNVTKESISVCVDPGHGGTEPGALGVDGAGYPDEKDFNLDMSLKLQTLLEAFNITVYMTRTDDSTVSLQDRCDVANENNTDIFVSVHCNSIGSPTTMGTETFYWGNTTSGVWSENGKRLAGYLQDELVNSTSRPNRGIHADESWLGYHLYVLQHTAMPASLAEVAFMSNQTEFDLLSTDAFRESAAQGIYNGILLYFGYPPEVFSGPTEPPGEPQNLEIAPGSAVLNWDHGTGDREWYYVFSSDTRDGFVFSTDPSDYRAMLSTSVHTWEDSTANLSGVNTRYYIVRSWNAFGFSPCSTMGVWHRFTFTYNSGLKNNNYIGLSYNWTGMTPYPGDNFASDIVTSIEGGTGGGTTVSYTHLTLPTN